MKNICKIADILDVSLEELAFTNLEYNKDGQKNKIITDINRELEFLSVDNLKLFNEIITIFNEK